MKTKTNKEKKMNDLQKELLKMAFSQSEVFSGENIPAHPFEIGEAYIIRTVTMIQTGRLKAVYKNELVLEEASWVADTGRFSAFVEDMDNVSEMEPIKGEFIVGRGAIVDAIKVSKLIRKLK